MKIRYRKNLKVKVLLENQVVNGIVVDQDDLRGEVLRYRIRTDEGEIFSTSEFYLKKKANRVKRIYLLKLAGTDIYKIGTSVNVISRLQGIKKDVVDYFGNKKIEILGYSDNFDWAVDLEFALHHELSQFNYKNFHADFFFREWFVLKKDKAKEIKSIICDKLKIFQAFNKLSKIKEYRIYTCMKFDSLHCVAFPMDNKLDSTKVLNAFRRFYISDNEFNTWLEKYLNILQRKTPTKIWQDRLSNHCYTYRHGKSFEVYKNMFVSHIDIKNYYYYARISEINSENWRMNILT
jgi:hypothetical protein